MIEKYKVDLHGNVIKINVILKDNHWWEIREVGLIRDNYSPFFDNAEAAYECAIKGCMGEISHKQKEIDKLNDKLNFLNNKLKEVLE